MGPSCQHDWDTSQNMPCPQCEQEVNEHVAMTAERHERLARLARDRMTPLERRRERRESMRAIAFILAVASAVLFIIRKLHGLP
jgi:hypothetical protein